MGIQQKKLGWLIILSCAVIPAVLWATLIPFSERIGTLDAVLLSLGQVTSLVGFVFFSLSFLLSARIRKIEDFFGGMNQVYIAHHLLGGIAFILLMIHPVLISFSYANRSIVLAGNLFIPGENWQINLGIAALFSMMSLLVLTYYIPLRYHLWKYTHKFLGLAFFIGVLHSFFIPSDISSSPIMLGYMLLISGIGLGAFAYRTLLWRWVVPRFAYQVANIIPLTDGTIEVELAPQNKKMPYLSGQFIFVGFTDGVVSKEVHPFSLSSSPQEPSLRIGVKALGDYTQILNQISVGSVAEVEGPFGFFSFSRVSNPRQIWIGGGIGITPFVGMVKDLVLEPKDYQVDLFYSVKNAEEAAYGPYLLELVKNVPNVRVTIWTSQTMSRLSAEKICELVPDATSCDIFVCGPPPMMKSLKTQFKKLHVKGSQIHSEEFAMS